MDPFVQTYREVFTPAMEELGFTRKRNIFHRLVNNKIIQRLSYWKPSGGHAFTIQFDFCPLISGVGYNDLIIDSSQTVDRLMTPFKGEWEYMDDEYVDQLPESLEHCKELVFPLFNRVTDYKSYYEYKKELNTHDGILLTILLMVGEYEIALDKMKAFLKRDEDFLSDLMESELEEKWAIEVKEDIKRYKTFIPAVEARDTKLIEQLLKESEEYSLQSYIKNYFGGQKKYEKYIAAKGFGTDIDSVKK